MNSWMVSCSSRVRVVAAWAMSAGEARNTCSRGKKGGRCTRKDGGATEAHSEDGRLGREGVQVGAMGCMQVGLGAAAP